MLSINIKKVFKVWFGILMVVFMCFSFSGYSLNIDAFGNITCRFFYSLVPAMSLMEENTIEEQVMNSISPLCGVLYESAKAYTSGVTVGEISRKIGDSNFVLYEKTFDEDDEVTGDVDIVRADGYTESADVMSRQVGGDSSLVEQLKMNMDRSFLIKNFYVVDSTTSIKKSLFNVEKMLSKDFKINKTDKPQILIYHTHGASESFKGSKEGVVEESIVGVGDYLTEVLTNTYGYNVYHDRSLYDSINGKIDRSLAYANALPSIKKILSENPTIEVVIDLHRDGVGKNVQTVTTVNGKSTAQIMFFNGLCRSKKGDREYLVNDNLSDNLAFSLQMKLEAVNRYPDFTKPIYLKGYRYNLHVLPKSLLVELGSQNNTFEEAKNAAEPLAEVLNAVLSGS